ncbi:MAG: hypothetical protein HQ502_12395 [Alphaproteobacteria bacterium]|nr:hypothetical protein [Alphaproteobacteria bacterium]
MSEPIRPWLPERVAPLLVAARHDPLHGALILAKSEAQYGARSEAQSEGGA